MSARTLHKQFTTGERSAVEIAEEHLKKIEAVDPKVGAFLEVFAERTLERARHLDEKKASGAPLGKMAGVPIGIKDNIHIQGEITTCASKFLENYRAPFDATVSRLLEAEDAVLIGKCNLDEFAMGSSTDHSAYKKTNNPWDLERTPGGSSGGSIAAVAARMVPLALGTETGGSVRQPASFCGVVGFKPTYGRVSRYGLVAFGSSFDQIGPAATTVDDVGMIMKVIGQHCPHDSTSIQAPADEYDMGGDIQGLKIGIPRSFLTDLSGEPKTNFDAAVKKLEDLGAKIIDVQIDTLKYSVPMYYVLSTAEASTNLARFDGVRYGKRSERAQTLAQVYDYSKEEGYGYEVKRRILLGTYVLSAGYQDAYYRKAQKVRTLMIREFNEAFKGCDTICMPVSPSTAWKRGTIRDPLQEYLADLYTISANLAGLPAISVPSGFCAEGMPMSIQFLGPQRSDAAICRIGHVYEQATRFGEKKPEVSA